MKPVFARELKELAPVSVLVLAFAVIAGSSFAGPLSRQFDDILAVSCVGAVMLGCFQGGLDRWRRADLFALHRPVPALRMEAARTLAGVTIAGLGIVALAVAHRISTLSHVADMQATRSYVVVDLGSFDLLGAREIALLSGFVLAAWAATRFAVGAVRIRWAIPALVAVTVVSWSFLSRTSIAATIGLALGLAVLFSAGGALCLAGDRR